MKKNIVYIIMKLDLKLNTKRVAIFLFFIMFIWSGISKIFNYSSKVTTLARKTKLPYPLNDIGMVSVIILEIIGTILIVYYFFGGNIDKKLVKYILQIYLLFMVVVTLLYHPPTDKIIPFLSNVTTTAGMLLIYDNIS